MTAADALRAVLDGGLAAWPGLPQGSGPADAEPVLDAPDGAPWMTDLGYEKAFVRGGELAGHPAEAWVTPDGAELLMVAVEEPPFAPDPAAVLAALGEPDLRRDAWRGTTTVTDGEWVWPRRGVAVFADTEDGQVWRAHLFAPCGAEEYPELYATRLGARRR